MGKKRYLEDKIDSLLAMFPVVAVVGPRQCGKSTMVRQLRPDWHYYDLENPSDYQLISSDPVAFFNLNSENIIIDEAQQYPEIFRVLRGVIDSDRQRKGRFILTGSSSPDIAKGVSESLAGRIATVEMWSFKQGEYYEREFPEIYSLLTGSRINVSDFRELKPVLSLRESMHVWFNGGFPEPLIQGENNPLFYNQWQENYIQSYLGRDIRGLFPRLNMHAFRRFLLLLAQFSGHQLNMSEMARALEVSVMTIKEYLDIIHQTFLWRNLTPYTKNLLKKVQKAQKGFFRDQGLLHSFLKIADPDSLLLHPAAGVSFASFVIEEIIRGIQATMATRIDYAYYRTIDKSEVDLVLDGTGGPIPVEIKLSSSINQRTLRGLKNFIADTGADFGVLVNRGRRVEQLAENIVQLPVNYL